METIEKDTRVFPKCKQRQIVGLAVISNTDNRIFILLVVPDREI